MHQNAFGLGPVGEAYSAGAPPYPLARFRERGGAGEGLGKGEGRGRRKKLRGGPLQCMKCVDAKSDPVYQDIDRVAASSNC